jgi:hypothetical protein
MFLTSFNPQSSPQVSSILPLRYDDLQIFMLDIGQNFILLSDICDQRHRTKPDIGISDIGLRERSLTLYRISE